MMRADRCNVCGEPFPADAADAADAFAYVCGECIAERFERDADARGTLADVADALRAVAPSVPARWTLNRGTI